MSGDVRAALLEAASTLFLRYGYRAVSSRQIAAAAGANPAMIRYYFGGKAGLYREMLEGVIAPLRARIERMAANVDTVDLPGLIGAITRAYAANPWIMGLVIREVLSPDGPLRPMFVKEIAGRMVPYVEKLVRSEIDGGALRRDLDPKLVLLSMIGLAVFPYLAYPVTSRLFGVSCDQAFVERLTRHNAELLRRGLLAAESGR